MPADFYYYISSLTQSPCHLEWDSLPEARRTWLCPGGEHPRPGVKAVDVWLQDRSPRDKPFNFVWNGGVGLVHRELLDLIGAEIVERDLYLGQIVGDGGRKVTDWVTFRGRRGLLLRGDQEAEDRVCETCGACLYRAQGKRWLHGPIPEDATIFASHRFGLIVPEEVYARVATKRWPKMSVTKVPVLSEPIDGLGEILFRY